MKSYEELQEENERMKAAIEWVDSTLTAENSRLHLRNELRARAFPPEVEEVEDVEVKAWHCTKCGANFDFKIDTCRMYNCDGIRMIELKGIDRIPKRKKVFRREKLNLRQVDFYNLGEGKYYREWEE